MEIEKFSDGDSLSADGDDDCRKRLLAALSRDLPEQTFSWRRPQAAEDPAVAIQRKENTLEDMRRRMAALSNSTAPQLQNIQTGLQQKDIQLPTQKSPIVAVAINTDEVSASFESADVGTSKAPDDTRKRHDQQNAENAGKREQFLKMLAVGLHGNGPVSRFASEKPMSGVEHARPDEPRDKDCGHMADLQGSCTGTDVQNTLDESPNFFAEMQALQERLAQRRAEFRANSASPVQLNPEPELGSSVFSSSRVARSSPSMEGRSSTSSPRHKGADVPPLLPQSEFRRPRPTHDGSSSARGRDSPAHVNSFGSEDEDLLNNGSNDELLRWAEEVLQRARDTEGAQSAPSGEFRDCGSAYGGKQVPSMNIEPPRVPRPPAQSSSVAARERRRRAEDLRSVMRRLTAESENECDRLAFEEEFRRRHIREQEQQQGIWLERITSAATEMRNNFARGCSFDGATVGGASKNAAPAAADSGSTGLGGPFANARDDNSSNCGSTPRGSSMPPPRPPSGASRSRPSPCTPRRAAATLSGKVAPKEDCDALWAQLEDRLEKGVEPIHLHNIPWPGVSSSITGAMPGDTATMVKQKLAGALRRWHPDKWRRILDRVPEAEQAKVMERVKQVAQRLLEEKAKLTGSINACR